MFGPEGTLRVAGEREEGRASHTRTLVQREVNKVNE